MSKKRQLKAQAIRSQKQYKRNKKAARKAAKKKERAVAERDYQCIPLDARSLDNALRNIIIM